MSREKHLHPEQAIAYGDLVALQAVVFIGILDVVEQVVFAIDDAQKTALALLRSHASALELEQIAARLQEAEVIEGSEIARIVG